jgi:hypothetical protein
MTEIRSESWDDFTAQVAEAVQGDEPVVIHTGSETTGEYVAVVGDGVPSSGEGNLTPQVEPDENGLPQVQQPPDAELTDHDARPTATKAGETGVPKKAEPAKRPAPREEKAQEPESE